MPRTAKPKLSASMTPAAFDNGYWYATELKEFAESLGIASANKLRKDELEKAIKLFLETGKIKVPTRRSLKKSGVRDLDKGLSLKLPVSNYTSNKQTKQFIEKEAEKIAPGLKKKSGARYRLNRWREEQLTNGVEITYGDLIKQYVALNQSTERFARIPHGRYINFMADFLKHEKNATRAQAIRAWGKLKTMDIPKDYRSWARYRETR